LIVVIAGCGKKGPPLPPLVKIPVAPGEMTAERRAARVDLRFLVPATNTDGTRPANIERVDVYAATSATALTSDQILKLGTKVASVDVKAPRDPNATAEPDESDADMDLPEGKGLDQGALAQLSEQLDDPAFVPVTVPRDKKADKRARASGPLLPAPMQPLSRTYVGIGFTTRGRKGQPSTRVAVPLTPPPAAPLSPTVTYDEKSLTLNWMPPAGAPATADQVLPSLPLGAVTPEIAYNVYDAGTKLTKEPLSGPPFSDSRLVWGEKRCYEVRTLEKIGSASIESAATPEVCKTPVDTFPPGAPKSLQAIASPGAITLIWEPNTERDLAGYVVMRDSGEGDLQPMMTTPITATSFRDDLGPGTHHIYQVRAVDKAGNRSAPSNRAEETARP
jgi:hypothetical protein